MTKALVDRMTLRGGVAAGTLGLLGVIIAMGGSVADATAADGSGAEAAPQVATTLSATTTKSYWTPQRLADAQPLDLARGAVTQPAVTQPASGGATGAEIFGRAAATPFKAVAVDRPEKYPNRVHGALFGTFAGVGDYSCSATVVSSGSESAIMTAGHCVFDAGESNRFATNLAFVPAYSENSFPYGIWTGTNAITTKQWIRRGSLDYDLAFIRLIVSPYGTIQSIIGSRGIGFGQKRRQHLSAYGYPADHGRKTYDGNHLIRCDSGYVPDPYRDGGPRSRGMRCDMKFGASGGGWVAQHSMLVSDTSHGYPGRYKNQFFGPYYGAVAKSLYKANTKSWPSIGPIRCRGKVATMIATNRNDVIRGTKGRDVIATLGGNDKIKGRQGADLICAGAGNDKIIAGGGKDRVIGGSGYDKCGGAKGNDSLKECEKKRNGRAESGR